MNAANSHARQSLDENYKKIFVSKIKQQHAQNKDSWDSFFEDDDRQSITMEEFLNLPIPTENKRQMSMCVTNLIPNHSFLMSENALEPAADIQNKQQTTIHDKAISDCTESTNEVEIAPPKYNYSKAHLSKLTLKRTKSTGSLPRFGIFDTFDWIPQETQNLPTKFRSLFPNTPPNSESVSFCDDSDEDFTLTYWHDSFSLSFSDDEYIGEADAITLSSEQNAADNFACRISKIITEKGKLHKSSNVTSLVVRGWIGYGFILGMCLIALGMIKSMKDESYAGRITQTFFLKSVVFFSLFSHLFSAIDGFFIAISFLWPHFCTFTFPLGHFMLHSKQKYSKECVNMCDSPASHKILQETLTYKPSNGDYACPVCRFKHRVFFVFGVAQVFNGIYFAVKFYDIYNFINFEAHRLKPNVICTFFYTSAIPSIMLMLFVELF